MPRTSPHPAALDAGAAPLVPRPCFIEFKASFDGAMFNESDEAGVGVVIRDSMGQVIATMAEKIRKPHSMECLEMVAARHAVVFAAEIGLQ